MRCVKDASVTISQQAYQLKVFCLNFDEDYFDFFFCLFVFVPLFSSLIRVRSCSCLCFCILRKLELDLAWLATFLSLLERKK